MFSFSSEPQEAVRQTTSNISAGWLAFAIGAGVAALGLALSGTLRAVGWLLGRTEGDSPTDNRVEVVVKKDPRGPVQTHLRPLARDLTPELEAARDEDQASQGSSFHDAE